MVLDPAVGTPGAGFRHLALFYSGLDGFVAGTLRFVVDGLASKEPVLVAAPADRLRALSEELRGVLAGVAADRPDGFGVRLLDMTDAGRNPGRILPLVLIPFAEANPGVRVRIIGEPVWARRTALEYPVCVQHEALINAAFAGRPATILCPYDTSTLRSAVIDDARTTHPILMEAGAVIDSAGYADPWSVIEARNRPLADPPAFAVTLAASTGSAGRVRPFVAERAYAAGVAADRGEELSTAIDRLVDGWLTGGGGPVTVDVWTEADDLVCQIGATGAGATDWTGADVIGGRGLVPLHRVADLARVSTRPGRSTVRIYLGRTRSVR